MGSRRSGAMTVERSEAASHPTCASGTRLTLPHGARSTEEPVVRLLPDGRIHRGERVRGHLDAQCGVDAEAVPAARAPEQPRLVGAGGADELRERESDGEG